MTARVLHGEPIHPDSHTPLNLLQTPIGISTTADKTPIFICTLESCYRLLPDKAKLLLHRARDHQLEEPDSKLWDAVITWPEVKKRELALESVAAAKKRVLETPQEAENVDIYAFEAVEETERPAVDPARASYLPLRGSTTIDMPPSPVIPQKRDAEEQLTRDDVVVDLNSAEETGSASGGMDYEPPDAAPDSPYEPPAASPVRSPSPMQTEIKEEARLTPVLGKVEPIIDAADTQAPKEDLHHAILAQPESVSVVKTPVETLTLPRQPVEAVKPRISPSIVTAAKVPILAKPSVSRLANRGAIPGLDGKTSSARPAVLAPLPARPLHLPAQAVPMMMGAGPRRTPPPPIPAPVVLDRRFIPRDELQSTPSERAKQASESDVRSILARLKAPSAIPSSGPSGQPPLASPTPQSHVREPPWMNNSSR